MNEFSINSVLNNLQSKEVSETDSFSVNEDFKHKLHRIQINSIQLKETVRENPLNTYFTYIILKVEENKKTNENVLQDRQYQVSTLSLMSTLTII